MDMIYTNIVAKRKKNKREKEMEKFRIQMKDHAVQMCLLISLYDTYTKQMETPTKGNYATQI